MVDNSKMEKTMETISQTEIYIFGVCLLVLLFIITIFLFKNSNNINRVLYYLDDESTWIFRRHNEMVKVLKDGYEMTREKLNEISFRTTSLDNSPFSKLDLRDIENKLEDTNNHLKKMNDKLDVIINKD